MLVQGEGGGGRTLEVVVALPPECADFGLDVSLVAEESSDLLDLSWWSQKGREEGMTVS
jgi:hypothetical protein